MGKQPAKVMCGRSHQYITVSELKKKGHCLKQYSKFPNLNLSMLLKLGELLFAWVIIIIVYNSHFKIKQKVIK